MNKMYKFIIGLMIVIATTMSAYAGLGRGEGALSQYSAGVYSYNPRIVKYRVGEIVAFILYENGRSVAEYWIGTNTYYQDFVNFRAHITGVNGNWKLFDDDGTVMCETYVTSDGVALTSTWNRKANAYCIGYTDRINVLLNKLFR